jgi:hypothetical protein
VFTARYGLIPYTMYMFVCSLLKTLMALIFYVCVYVCVNAFVCVCVSVRIYESISVFIYVYMKLRIIQHSK